jgi:hypothetical protein
MVDFQDQIDRIHLIIKGLRYGMDITGGGPGVSGGEIDGLRVTIKDATNLYVWGGQIRINGSWFRLLSQLTFPTGTLTADTLYYFYVGFNASDPILTVGNFSLSTAGFEVGSTPPLPPYDHAKGARYHVSDGTKRWLANYHTA